MATESVGVRFAVFGRISAFFSDAGHFRSLVVQLRIPGRGAGAPGPRERHACDTRARRGTEQERKATPTMAGHQAHQAQQAQQTLHVGGEWREDVSPPARSSIPRMPSRSPWSRRVTSGTRTQPSPPPVTPSTRGSGPAPPSPSAPRCCAASPTSSSATARSWNSWRAATRGRPWKRGGSTSTVSRTPSGTSPTSSWGRVADGSSTPGQPTSTASSCTSPSVSAR